MKNLDGICKTCGSHLPPGREYSTDGELWSWYECEVCNSDEL